MSLQVQFSMAPETLLYQQDTNCHVTLTNPGTKSIQVMHPKMDITQPMVQITTLLSGAEDTYQRSKTGHESGEEPLSLAPGEKLAYEFNLFAIVPPLDPGTYEVSLAWKFNDNTGVAESDPLPLTILPTTPKNIHLVDAVGGRGVVKNAVWMDLANKPSRILYCRLLLEKGGGVETVMEVATAPLKSRPVMSAPVRGEPLKSHWIGWIEGQAFNYTHVDRALGVLEPRQISLPMAGFEIVPPLLGRRATHSGLRPGGDALLCQAIPGESQFTLIKIELEPENTGNPVSMKIPGPKPLWAMCHGFTKDHFVVTYLQKKGKEALLFMVGWPVTKDPQPIPIPIGKWQGTIRGIGARILIKKGIQGGLLMEKSNRDGVRQVVLVQWSVSDSGTVDISPDQIIDWDPSKAIVEARLGIKDNGMMNALIHDEKGKWHVASAKGITPVGAKYQATKLPMELGFIGGAGEPCLICARLTQGIEITNVDGTPLPPGALK